ncbi:MAG: ATP-binding protein, partial [Perlucidibaca sp.]
VNLLTLLRLRASVAVSDDELFLQLLFDVLLLTALFLQSGGSGNPFVTYYLVPLAIAASTLGWLQTAALAVFMLIGYSSLFLFAGASLPEGMSWPWHSYAGHLAGMWVNFAISSALLVIFVGRMQRRLREQDRLMAEQQRRQLQRDQAVAMGTLAATAVHELATPLATLTLVGGELAETLPADSPQRESVLLLQSQLARCRQILADLREQARQPDMAPRRSLREHASGWLQPLMVWHAGVRFELVSGAGSEAVVAIPWLLRQVLQNLLQNAAEASRSRVELRVEATAGQLHCTICDDGAGWPQELLGRLGQPAVSSKPDGLGLGVFLSQVTVAELGGSLSLDNADGGGAEVHLCIPLAALERNLSPAADGRRGDAPVAG